MLEQTASLLFSSLIPFFITSFKNDTPYQIYDFRNKRKKSGIHYFLKRELEKKEGVGHCCMYSWFFVGRGVVREVCLDCAKWKQCWLGRSRWQLIGSGQTGKTVPSKLIGSATSVAAFLLEIFTWKPGLQAGVWNNFSLHWTLTSLQKPIKTICITFLDANFPLSHTDLGALRVT